VTASSPEMLSVRVASVEDGPTATESIEIGRKRQTQVVATVRKEEEEEEENGEENIHGSMMVYDGKGFAAEKWRSLGKCNTTLSSRYCI
jgi:CO dehydrogenase/acetyl-CoA synthase beta subunit